MATVRVRSRMVSRSRADGGCHSSSPSGVTGRPAESSLTRPPGPSEVHPRSPRYRLGRCGQGPVEVPHDVVEILDPHRYPHQVGRTPAAAWASSERRWWVVDAGWITRVRVSPTLARWLASSTFSMKARPPSSPPRTPNANTAPGPLAGSAGPGHAAASRESNTTSQQQNTASYSVSPAKRSPGGGRSGEVDPIEANALHGGRMSLIGSMIVAAQTMWSSGVGAAG